MPASRHFGLSSWGMLNLVHRKKGTHTQGDYQLLNGSVVARRINVKRFTFSHFSQMITPYHPCGPPHTYPATSSSNTTHFAQFFPLVCGLFVSLCTYTLLIKQPAKCLHSKILERPEQKSNRPTGAATFYSKCHYLSLSIYPLHHHGQRASGNHLNLIHGRSKVIISHSQRD